MMIMHILNLNFLRKKALRWTLVAAALGIVCFQNQAPADWQRPLQPSFAGGNLVCLSAHPLETSKFLVANRFQLFEGSGEKDWKTLWSDSGHGAMIQNILTFPWIQDSIFLITSEKILIGRIGDNSWHMIYAAGNRNEKRPLAFAVTPQDANKWYVGTPKGLLFSQDAGRTWSRANIFSGTTAVTVLFAQGNKLFIGDENHLYLSMNGSPAHEVLSLPQKEMDASGNPEIADAISAEDASYYIQQIRALIAAEAPSCSRWIFPLSTPCSNPLPV